MITWRYPQGPILGEKDLTVPCPRCGAPSGAYCMTRTGRIADPRHIDRHWAASDWIPPRRRARIEAMYAGEQR